jgi:hypothetical protein
MKEMIKFIAPIIAAQAIALYAVHAKAEYQQVTHAQAIQALKKRPNGAEVYQCFKRGNRLECKRVKLAIVTVQTKKYALQAK